MITISHTHADGTLIEGSSKGDGVYDILKGLGGNWRYFPSIRQIGIGQSRDRNADTYKISRAAEALRAAGYEVTVTVDESERRTFAEAEAERYERAEDRAERMAGYAANAAERSTAAYERSRQMADAIPFGQPMMPDHYSYGRDRRYRDRMHSLMGKSIEEGEKAEHYEHRAGNAETYRQSRESVPVTLRRIEKLEADLRRVQRNLAGREEYVSDGVGGYTLKLVKPGPKWQARLEALQADLSEQIAYWRNVVAEAEASGVKVWTRADFKPGDYVKHRWGWAEVLRVNAKSLTIPWGSNAVHLDVVTRDNVTTAIGGSGWTEKVTYDDVTGRKGADEMAAYLAEQELATA
jgi:hypothetical protein